ncbi:hypothetical protein K8R42_03690 [bacterium]|nr:hypothetical protein [bacterium]
MNDYQPLSPKELERSYFFLTHRRTFIKAFFGVAILALLVLYGIMFLNLFGYLRAGNCQNVAMALTENVHDWTAYHQQRQPTPIKVMPAQFLALGSRRYNLVAYIENPNPDWSVTSFQYYFVANGQPLPAEIAYINPGESKMILTTGYEAPLPLSNVDVVVSDFKWRRDEGDLPPIAIVVNNIRFLPATERIQGERIIQLPATVSWQAENNSLYNLWEINFQIALFSNNKLASVEEIVVRDFFSLEKKDLEAVWTSDLSRITSTEVYPVFNKLDFDNYKDLYVDPSSDNRIKL